MAQTCAIPLSVPVLHQYIYYKNSQILRNSLKFAFLTISGFKQDPIFGQWRHGLVFTTHGSKLTTPENTLTYHNALCLSPQNFAWVFSVSLGAISTPKRNKTMLMQNVGVTNKECYGMLWYFLELSIGWSSVQLFVVCSRGPNRWASFNTISSFKGLLVIWFAL